MNFSNQFILKYLIKSSYERHACKIENISKAQFKRQLQALHPNLINEIHIHALK